MALRYTEMQGQPHQLRKHPMKTALNVIVQTENLDFLARHARHYSNSAKAYLKHLRNPEHQATPTTRGDLKKALQFCLGERRWARRAMLAKAH
jgi:hypothetical protein